MQQGLLGMLTAIRQGGLLGRGLNTWLDMAALVAITGLIWAAWYLALCGFCRSAPCAMGASIRGKTPGFPEENRTGHHAGRIGSV
jgi:hypothetical protein